MYTLIDSRHLNLKKKEEKRKADNKLKYIPLKLYTMPQPQILKCMTITIIAFRAIRCEEMYGELANHLKNVTKSATNLYLP